MFPGDPLTVRVPRLAPFVSNRRTAFLVRRAILPEYWEMDRGCPESSGGTVIHIGCCPARLVVSIAAELVLRSRKHKRSASRLKPVIVYPFVWMSITRE